MAYQRIMSAWDQLNQLSDAYDTNEMMEVIENAMNDIRQIYDELEVAESELDDLLNNSKTVKKEGYIKDQIEGALDSIKKARKDLY